MINTAGQSGTADISKKAVLQDFIYTSIKERIINGEIPPGGIIIENSFTEEFGTSRTPIREALLRLQRDRLVSIYPRQGTFATQISIKDVYEIFDIRLLIEPAVARQICPTVDLEKMESFREQFGDKNLALISYKKWFYLDRSFHDFLIESSGNETLIRTYQDIMDQHLRVRILAGKSPSRANKTNDEHIRIIDAFARRDAEAVEQYMREHIIASREAAVTLDRF
ncbi:GntR family transcriptional regulator [Marispirochaeta aestuarii]|uniref:GntR family transcriptional regulator n=1 Tax=Marispirochaeta aestuarii TaxID=1963862 RepID=UPI0029C76199|nr:GntR family transcriptional regulator [Marispirochaeta aestuarii]